MLWFFKLHPPRPSFAQDLTPAEAALMQSHAAYWMGHMQQGRVVVFGLVGDAAAAYGVGIMDLAADIDPHPLGADDPVIRADVGFRYEIHPMPRAVARP